MAIRYKIMELARRWERENGAEPEYLTYRKLAELTKMSPATLNRMANGKSSGVEHESIETLMDFFNCGFDELMEREKNLQ